MGAAFLCGHCGIENTILDQSASYIQNWLERLKNDRKLVIRAGTQAQKASDFVLNIKHVPIEAPDEVKPKEFKVVALRECPVPEKMEVCETPDHAAGYWHLHIKAHPHFNPEVECFAVLFLNNRRKTLRSTAAQTHHI
jgi:hypothetical protein